jgi:hypothetical protein
MENDEEDSNTITVKIDDLMSSESYLGTSYTYPGSLTATNYTTLNVGNLGMGSILTGNLTGAATLPVYNTYSYTTAAPIINYTGNGVTISGDADIDGDLKIKGVSLTDTLKTIEKRLSILVPNPKKLAKYEALRKAYEHYKTLEALCDLPEDDENGSTT